MTNTGKAKALLVIMLADVINFLSVGQTMGETQLIQTVELILNDVNFKNLKPDDFKVCFDNAKKGYYGKSYNRIDGMIICEWLGIYCSERADICESMAIQKSEADKKRLNVIAPEMVEFYKEVLKENKGFVEPEKTPVIPVKKVIVKSQRDIFIQKCFQDHYEIWLKKPYKAPKNTKPNPDGVIEGSEPTGRFILFDGKICDELKYTEIKLTQYDNQLIESGKEMEL